jgi:hypothetical protein
MANLEPKRESPKSGLSFKPLTDGLGFHPFSDGLPYAPQSKAKTSHSLTRAPIPQSVSTLPPVVSTPRIAQPVQNLAAPVIIYEPEDIPSEGIDYVFARSFAYFLDTALIFAGFAAGISTYLAHFAVPSGREASLQDWAYVILVLGTLHWALITFQEVAFGTTVGKRVMGLKLSGSAAALFLRAFFFAPSALCLGLGFLPALLDRRRRCLHDLVVDLQPEWKID